jgi:hypothetical protein
MLILLYILIGIILLPFVPKKYIAIYSCVVNIVLVSLYFFIDPPVEYDLYRHYQFFDTIKHLDIWNMFSSDAINKYAVSSFTADACFKYIKLNPLFYIISWCISRFGVKELLPVIIGLITYSNYTWIIYDFAIKKRNDKVSYIVAYSLVLLLMDFRGVSGIRDFWASSVFALAIYFDFILKKSKKSLIFYLMSISIHYLYLIYFLVRILYIWYKNVGKIYLNLILLFGLSLIQIVSQIAVRYFSLNSYVGRIINTYNFYMNKESEIHNGGTIIMSYLLYVVALLIGIYIIKKVDKQHEYKCLYNYYIMLFLFTVGVFSQYDLIIRFTNTCIIFIAFYVIIILSNKKYINYNHILKKLYIRQDLLWISTGFAFAVCLRVYYLLVYGYNIFQNYIHF